MWPIMPIVRAFRLRGEMARELSGTDLDAG